MADINGVKLINDTFGHADGDSLIVNCANIIRDCCRDTDTLARIGGDEFVVIMPRTDNSTASAILNDIQVDLSAFDRSISNVKYRHSVSLGMSTKQEANEDIAQTLKSAEKFMYQRKLLEHSNSHSAIVTSIKAAMSEKSQETKEHAERIAILSRAVATELNLSHYDQDRLELLATLHDIGKIGVSDQILTKAEELSDEEWSEMESHPEIGYRIAVSSPEFMTVAHCILCHHERWDGSGYPRGLSGENIPLLARILAVVDAYDAMTQDRPYRKAMTHGGAIEEIKRNFGTQFDPHIAALFVRIIQDQKLRELYARFPPTDITKDKRGKRKENL